jgi:Xaa-Pro aminopeptidase
MPLEVSESKLATPFPPDYRLVPALEIRHRIQRAQQVLDDNDLTGLLILQIIDLFYFTGTLQNGILWLPAIGEPVFWVRHSLIRARQESPLSDIRPHPSSSALKKELSIAND